MIGSKKWYFFILLTTSPSIWGAPCEGVSGTFHKNPDGSQGGFVANTAKVAPTVFVDASSSVCEQGKVQGNVRVKSGSFISGQASIEGNSEINSSRVYGSSKVYGRAQVVNSAVCQASDINFKVVNSDYYCQTDDPEPKDPGEAGKKTILGIDSDVDGVRDDVEIWINNLTTNRVDRDMYNERMALKQASSAKRRMEIHRENPQALYTENLAYEQAQNCVIDINPNAADMLNQLAMKTHNTIPRLDAYVAMKGKLSGKISKIISGTRYSTCSFKLRSQ